MPHMFDQEHHMFRQLVRQFVAQEIEPYVDAWEAQQLWPAHTLLRTMGKLGLLGLSYPEEYGGAGLDYWYNVVLFEELGRCSCGGVPMAIGVHTDMATPALAQYGSEELKQRFLVPAIAGTMCAAIAISEPDAGSDVAAIRTRAEPDGDDYVINGSKMWITNGTQADFVVVLARTSPGHDHRGMSLIVVPTDTPGFSVSRKLEKLGMHSSDTAILSFDNVRVPQAFRIGDEGAGFPLQMQQFQKERLIASVMGLAAAERAIELTVTYTKQRQAFGKPLIAQQWIQFKLAELLSEVEALRHLCYHCTELIVAGQDATLPVSMAKLKVGRLARQVADTCLQFHGGMGYVEEYPIARYFRDSRLLSIAGGADEIMLGIIAKYAGLLPSKSEV
jgi:citronellyl-CoA dehydrogenase